MSPIGCAGGPHLPGGSTTLNRYTFRMPAAALLATGAVALLAAPPAHATGGAGTAAGGDGRADAAVLRAGLDVGLLNKAVHVPLKTALNEVSAPASAQKTALSVTLDGVEGGRPVHILKADAATSKATAGRGRAEAEANLARARVHLPGLPALSLIEVEKATSKAVCQAGRKPSATSNVLGSVTVLGKKATLSAGGPTKVEVPKVGMVSLELSGTETTSSTAAAAALRLKVSVNPLDLNVAQVEGEVVLAEARCQSPAGPPPSSAAPEPSGGGMTATPDVKPQTGASGTGAAITGDANLAETGGSSATPWVAGGALVLLGLGGVALVVTRRRSS
ncbi:hypothetical protein SUDANB120_01556 [Streptomyces sp. enrichment culture]